MKRKPAAAGGTRKRSGKRSRRIGRKKVCRLCSDKSKPLDYKDVKRMESFVTERGKILSSRISGNCAKHQRVVAEAVKKARFVSLLPYTR
ncbi:MAG: 30S ribosomal protein S18 [Candidatus Omnitrophica bacterium]|nr:30S ribosomal protein S18 [Candidatus Omnitrophota bacterium]